jgi:hypothetical protein
MIARTKKCGGSAIDFDKFQTQEVCVHLGLYLLVNRPQSALRAICIPRYVAASISARTNEGEAAAASARFRVQSYCLSGFYGPTDLRS